MPSGHVRYGSSHRANSEGAGAARGQGAERAPAERASTAGGREAASYFTTGAYTVIEPRAGRSSRVELWAVGCRTRFCPHCCLHRGLALREKLEPELAGWSALQMWTLTVDPKLFDGPEAAYRYVRENRCIARVVRALKREGWLDSERWICIVEWQEHTEMAHYHLLLETSYVPFERIAELWGQFRPASAPIWQGSYARSLEGQEPEFGHVRFSKGRGSRGGTFKSRSHAARYVCKYLTKVPDHGYPDWVLAFDGQIRRFSTSRGLLPSKPRRKPPQPCGIGIESHEDDCWCALCRGDVDFIDSGSQLPRRARAPQSTLRTRLAKCGTTAVLVRIELGKGIDGTVIPVARHFLCGLKHLPYEEAASICTADHTGSRRVPITWGQAQDLISADGWRGQEKQRAERRNRRERFDAMCAIGLFD